MSAITRRAFLVSTATAAIVGPAMRLEGNPLGLPSPTIRSNRGDRI